MSALAIDVTSKALCERVALVPGPFGFSLFVYHVRAPRKRSLGVVARHRNQPEPTRILGIQIFFEELIFFFFCHRVIMILDTDVGFWLV